MYYNYLEKNLDKKAKYIAIFYLFLVATLIIINLVFDLNIDWTEFLLMASIPVILILFYGLLLGILLLFFKIGNILKSFSK